MDNTIAQVVVGLPVAGPFDYFIPTGLRQTIKVGGRVWVQFGHRRKVGYVIGFACQSRWKKLKNILTVIDETPVLNEALLNLTQKISDYYACSRGEAIETVLPDLIRQGKAVKIDAEKTPEGEALNDSGAAGLALIHSPHLTQHWSWTIPAIKKCLTGNQRVIFLVPEVILIDDIVSKLKRDLSIDDVVVLDRRLTLKKELEEWQRIKNNQARIVVGTRSAIFAPVNQLGLIVVYEEENSAYKQEQSPFYHVRDIALWRAKEEKCRVGFISAVPSLELWQLARRKPFKKEIIPSSKKSKIIILDLLNYHPRKTPLVSFPLRNQIERTLKDRGRVILFMNRLGFNWLTRCPKCQHTLRCRRCSTNLIYSYAKKKLICRLCHETMSFPKECPQCHSASLKSMGLGIEKTESELARLFPQARVRRYDKEVPHIPPDFDILVATQAILRETGKISIPLVGVLQMDAELNRHDFRSAERAFDLLVHLEQLTSEQLIVQTKLSDNYCLKAAAKMDFKYFYKEELNLRRELSLPPFRHLVAVGLRGIKEEIVSQLAQEFYNGLLRDPPRGIEILEPHPDVIPKLRDKFRFTILVKGKSVEKIVRLIRERLKEFKKKQGVVISVNVDP